MTRADNLIHLICLIYFISPSDIAVKKMEPPISETKILLKILQLLANFQNPIVKPSLSDKEVPNDSDSANENTKILSEIINFILQNPKKKTGLSIKVSPPINFPFPSQIFR